MLPDSTSVRDLATGEGARYGYADGLLVLEIPSQGAGRQINYAADGTVLVGPVVRDLGTAPGLSTMR